VDADLFASSDLTAPQRAWQVIDAARRQFITGELLLDTAPPTRVYLRDGQVYYAERTTDGGLGVRLLVEGVITREQMHKGTLHVSGVEHLGRMFDRDTSIDRDAVQLCVELMTDDVLAQIADETVQDFRMAMYKRHPSGIDRWLPTRVEVITHVVSTAQYADPDAVVTPGAPVRPKAHLPAMASDPTPPAVAPEVVEPIAPAPVAAPVVAEPLMERFVFEPVVSEPVVSEPVVSEPVVETPPALPVAADIPRLEPPAFPPAFQPIAPPADVEPAPAMVAPQPAAFEPLRRDAFSSDPVSELPTSLLPVVDPLIDPMLDGSAPSSGITGQIPVAPADDDTISLAPEAMHAIMTSGIADEVAEAVRRALAAIDAAPPADEQHRSNEVGSSY
jgi:hypothetical protein